MRSVMKLSWDAESSRALPTASMPVALHIKTRAVPSKISLFNSETFKATDGCDDVGDWCGLPPSLLGGGLVGTFDCSLCRRV